MELECANHDDLLYNVLHGQPAGLEAVNMIRPA
jgi:hypothetical protein